MGHCIDISHILSNDDDTCISVGNTLLTFDMFADHVARPIGTLVVVSVGKYLIQVGHG